MSSRKRMDEILKFCNETELLQLARKQGVGILRRGIPLETLIKIVTGEEEVKTSQLSGTMETRAKLERFIQENIERTRSQLPGCTGRCTTFPCTEGRHGLCYGVNENTVS
jgi:hypothetical protein